MEILPNTHSARTYVGLRRFPAWARTATEVGQTQLHACLRLRGRSARLLRNLAVRQPTVCRPDLIEPFATEPTGSGGRLLGHMLIL
jgi:hypothetical protein